MYKQNVHDTYHHHKCSCKPTIPISIKNKQTQIILGNNLRIRNFLLIKAIYVCMHTGTTPHKVHKGVSCYTLEEWDKKHTTALLLNCLFVSTWHQYCACMCMHFPDHTQLCWTLMQKVNINENWMYSVGTCLHPHQHWLLRTQRLLKKLILNVHILHYQK